jgi:hypothetical protein
MVKSLALAFVAAIFINACGESPSPPRVTNPRDKVSPTIFEPYIEEHFPKLKEKLGDAWERLQSVRETAALQVASSAQCDYVEMAEASDRSTPANIVIFVDCRNHQRMFVNEHSIARGANGVFQSEKTVDQSSAIEACSEAAKSLVMYPELADIHTWSGSAFNADKTTGNAQVFLDFDAKNALGIEFEYTARCVFPTNARPEIQVQPRK